MYAWTETQFRVYSQWEGAQGGSLVHARQASRRETTRRHKRKQEKRNDTRRARSNAHQSKHSETWLGLELHGGGALTRPPPRGSIRHRFETLV